MDEGAAVRESVDRILKYVHAIIDELDDFSGKWNHLDEGERVSWSLDWDQAMGAHLRFLEQQYGRQVMTEAQAGRYRDLLRRIKEHLPVIHGLGLYSPPLPLEV